MEEVRDAWRDSLKDETQQENVLERYQIDSADVETILDPNESLHRRAPLYLPEDGNSMAPPVFFLTKLSKAKERLVKAELGTIIDVDTQLDSSVHNKLGADIPKEFYYVP